MFTVINGVEVKELDKIDGRSIKGITPVTMTNDNDNVQVKLYVVPQEKFEKLFENSTVNYHIMKDGFNMYFVKGE